MKRSPKNEGNPTARTPIEAGHDAPKPVGEMIRSLRTEKGGWTQKRLAEELGVSRESVNVWEKELRLPPNEILAKLGSIALNSEHRREFWKLATTGATSLRTALRAEIVREWEKINLDQVVQLPVFDNALNKIAGRIVAYPAGCLLHPESTFCLEIGRESRLLSGLLQEGDTAVIDGARTDLIGVAPKLLAAYFEVIPSLQPSSWAHQTEAERRYLEGRNIQLSDEEIAFNAQNGPKPGVRFGWNSLVEWGQGTERFDGEPDRPWCYVLEPAKVRGMNEIGRALQLTDWQTGEMPRSEAELKKCLGLKRIRILGTVIGWISDLA